MNEYAFQNCGKKLSFLPLERYIWIPGVLLLCASSIRYFFFFEKKYSLLHCWFSHDVSHPRQRSRSARFFNVGPTLFSVHPSPGNLPVWFYITGKMQLCKKKKKNKTCRCLSCFQFSWHKKWHSRCLSGKRIYLSL